VVVSDPDAKALDVLRTAFPEVVVRGDNLPTAGQDVVFLAVHPPALRGVLGELHGRVPPASLVVSLAPKLTIADIRGALGGVPRVARVIPNAPSIVGAGFNPVALSPGLPSTHRETLSTLMAPLGVGPEVAEHDLEAYAVLTGMGPTYLWFQLYELLAIAERFGLAPGAAAEALQAMAQGTLRAMAQSGLSPAEVMDLVPVRPLAEEEQAFKDAYRARLRAVFDKIRPAVVAV
jgi:pyrroline-5-carboxylate reductase